MPFWFNSEAVTMILFNLRLSRIEYKALNYLDRLLISLRSKKQ